MSEMVILDTHIWFWLINGSFERFPTQWLEQIRQVDIVAVSAISCYEVALAHNKARFLMYWTLD